MMQISFRNDNTDVTKSYDEDLPTPMEIAGAITSILTAFNYTPQDIKRIGVAMEIDMLELIDYCVDLRDKQNDDSN